MTHHFMETAGKPQLFVFSQQLETNQEDERLFKFITDFESEFQQRQDLRWSKYWETNGHFIVLQTWKFKYRDYLLETTETTQISIVDEELCAESNRSLAVVEDKITETTISENSVEQLSWQELWQQHSEEIYFEQYCLFSSIYFNYFLDFKNSLLKDIEISTNQNQGQEEFAKANETHDRIVSELEQLKLLGLPTSFGVRPQTIKKKKKGNYCDNDYFSVWFSDDEENIDDDNDTDELCKIMEGEEEKGANKISLASGRLENDSGHNVLDKSIAKSNKKKNRKLRKIPSYILEDKSLLKYWRKRFSLFSRFDEGIRLDRESWFSVTPEKVAEHLAERLACDILIDGFCGSGGNAIQFAKTCNRVIAIDIDPLKIEMAKHNAKIYGIADKIDFIIGDFFHLCTHLRGDTVFLSPPWGGPKYKNKEDYDVEKFLLPVGASNLVECSRQICDNVALFLPRNSNLKQIIKIAGIGNRCEVEHNYLDTRLIAITALYGEKILRGQK